MKVLTNHRAVLALQLAISSLPALSTLLITSPLPYLLCSASFLMFGLAITNAWLSAEIEKLSSVTALEAGNNAATNAVTLYVINTTIYAYAAITLVSLGGDIILLGLFGFMTALVSAATITLTAHRYSYLQVSRNLQRLKKHVNQKDKD